LRQSGTIRNNPQQCHLIHSKIGTSPDDRAKLRPDRTIDRQVRSDRHLKICGQCSARGQYAATVTMPPKKTKQATVRSYFTKQFQRTVHSSSELPLKQPARKQPSTQKKARTEGDLPPGEDNSDFPLTQPARSHPSLSSLTILARSRKIEADEEEGDEEGDEEEADEDVDEDDGEEEEEEEEGYASDMPPLADDDSGDDDIPTCSISQD
jgi:hypothetical protein